MVAEAPRSGAMTSRDAIAAIAEAIRAAQGLSGRALFDALAPLADRYESATEVLDAAIAEMAASPGRGVAVPVHAGKGVASLRLYRDQDIAYSLMLHDRRAAPGEQDGQVQPISISFTGGWSRLTVVGGGPALATRYRRVSDDDGEPLRREDGRETLVPGRSITLANATEVLRFDSIAHDMATLRLTVRDPQCEQVRMFDAVTGRALGLRQAREEDGRARMLMTLLRSLRRGDAVPAIAATMAESPADLRWETMRECLALDARQARPLLVAMARQDPSPELRGLADRTFRWLADNYPELGVELAAAPAHAG